MAADIKRFVRFTLLETLAPLAVALTLTTVTAAEARATCPAANPNDFVSDDGALNACLAAGGTLTLTSGKPGYMIATGLYITVPVILDGGPAYAGLVAHPSLVGPILRSGYDYWGNELPSPPQNFTVSRMVFDGNKIARSTSICAPPADNRYGYNLMIRGAAFTVDNIYSINALCGTGLEVVGSGYQVMNSFFSYNHGDGLTARTCTNGSITNNVLVDNEDVGLVIGDGTGFCSVAGNQIHQNIAVAYTGLLVGFHAGANVVNNSVYSGYNKIMIGLMVGGHPWNDGSPANTFPAGNVQYNYIEGAVVLAAIDGISSGTFVNNTGSNRQGIFSCPNKPAMPPIADSYVVNPAHIGSANVQLGWVSRDLDHCFQ